MKNSTEASIHNLLDGEAGSGDYTMLGIGILELPVSPEAIEAAMNAGGVRLTAYSAAACACSLKPHRKKTARFILISRRRNMI